MPKYLCGLIFSLNMITLSYGQSGQSSQLFLERYTKNWHDSWSHPVGGCNESDYKGVYSNPNGTGGKGSYTYTTSCGTLENGQQVQDTLVGSASWSQTDPNNPTYYHFGSISYTTKFSYLTGMSDPTRALASSYVHVFTVGARETDAWGNPLSVVPANQVSFMGKHPDSSGQVAVSLADSTTPIDATPSVVGVSVAKLSVQNVGKFEFTIFNDDSNAPLDSKEKIVVGRRMHLSARLSGHSATEISNIEWSITGKLVEAWNTDALNASKQDVSNFNTQTISFAWWGPTTTQRLQVFADFAGERLTCTISVAVVSPTIPMTVTRGPVYVKNDILNHGEPGFPGSTNVPGIQINASQDPSKVLIIEGEYQWVTVLYITFRKKRVTDNTWEIFTASNKLDNLWPLKAAQLFFCKIV